MERTTQFLRYLPECGYTGRVVTTAAFGGAEDEGVVRAWEPLQLYRWLRNRAARAGRADSTVRTEPGWAAPPLRLVRRWLLVPDGQITWVPDALRRAWGWLRREPADLIYSSYPPASAHLLALLLQRLTGRPWVADFRDSWVADPLDPLLCRMPRRRALEARLEAAVVRHADAVVASTELAAEHLRRVHPAGAHRVEVITNGYDPDDLPDPAGGPAGGEELRIVHTGAFSVSHPQRRPEPLFAALEALVAADPGWARRLHLVLAGPLTLAEREAAAGLQAAGVVECRGVVSRPEALACQRQAHVLLLVDHPRDWPATNVPGKLYEYLGMRRPVLALCGPGMVERLVQGLGAGVCVRPDDAAAIRGALVALYERFRNGSLSSAVDEAALRRYHRRELALQLGRCFDSVLAAQPAGPSGA